MTHFHYYWGLTVAVTKGLSLSPCYELLLSHISELVTILNIWHEYHH